MLIRDEKIVAREAGVIAGETGTSMVDASAARKTPAQPHAEGGPAPISHNPTHRADVTVEEIRQSHWWGVDVDRAAGDEWWSWGWGKLGGCTHPEESDGGWATHRREMAHCGSARWVGGRWLTHGPNGGRYIFAAPRVWVLTFGPMDVPNARVRGPTLYKRDRTLDGFPE